LFEVAHNQGIDHLDVFIVKSLQVVVEHRDVLSQTLDLLPVLS
jgi:hypothetical protein